MEINKPWLHLRVVPRRPGSAPLGFFLALPMVALPLGGWLLESGRLTLAQCTFKSILGIPCMGCGATRATLNLMHGDIAEALSFSPMMTLIYGLLLLWGPWSLWMYARGRELDLHMASWLAWTVRIALIATPFVNWGYLITQQI